MSADPAAQATIRARSTFADWPRRARPSASSEKIIRPTSRAAASISGRGRLVPLGEHVAVLRGQADQQQAQAEHQQQRRRGRRSAPSHPADGRAAGFPPR